MRRIILDTEATGGSVQKGARAVEIGAIETLDHVPTGRVFHAYIDPRRSIEWGATRIHGLTAASLRGKPIFRDIAGDLLAFLGADPILAHGSRFDRMLLAAEFGICAMPAPPTSRWSCTQQIVRQHAPGERVGLEHVAMRLGVSFPGKPLHGALVDAAVLSAVLARLHDAGDVVAAKEFLLSVMLEGEPDIRSPHGLYGYPPMWNLLEREGVTMAIRPAATQEHDGFRWREVPGICWGLHRDGEWIKGEQHKSSTFDHFIRHVLMPELEAGALLVTKNEIPEGAPTP